MASRRGPLPNPLREEARLLGERYYFCDAVCDFCGTNKRYTSNGACVACAVARGSARYAAMADEDREALRQRDHARYLARCVKGG